ncbi:MAG: hypothetical protein QG628_75 [Patescibacteria group bacterium]|jgi:phosphatidylinositol alpha-mannosyltransferase|nr:hypothetical protein [Patescibacteria group bacterium]
MKVGIVCPYNYFRPGGVQECIRELAQELEARGHEVRVIVPQPKVVPDKIDKNVIMIGGSTEFNTPFATKADVGMSISNEKIDQLFAAEKFDILHVHEPGVPVLAAQLLGRSKTVNVATMHATLPGGVVSKSFEKIMTPFAKYLAPRIDAITAVSTVARQTALAYVPGAKIELVPNGINLAAYTPTKNIRKTTKQKSIVYIGRLEKRKGVRYLLDAYALLRKTQSDVHLIIAGDGKLRAGLEARVQKFEIPDVTFLGFISEDKKIELLRNADLYCSPALYGESFGIVLLEAMAAGAVVVCGNNPGYASVMTGRGRLSLVDPLSTVEFTRRIDMLLHDEQVRQLWTEWANEYVRQFDYPKIVDQYLAVYKKAIKEKKRSA